MRGRVAKRTAPLFALVGLFRVAFVVRGLLRSCRGACVSVVGVASRDIGVLHGA